MFVYYSVILAAQAARLSGLNLGITTAIWSFMPFFVAISERILYGTGVKPYQILGMLLIVLMSILVSLSDLFGNPTTETTMVIIGKRMPVYEAVLYSLVFPVMATAMTLLIKYSYHNMRVSGVDFGMAFLLFYSMVFFAIGLYMWISNAVEFTWRYFL